MQMELIGERLSIEAPSSALTPSGILHPRLKMASTERNSANHIKQRSHEYRNSLNLKQDKKVVPLFKSRQESHQQILRPL
jgi:hypothetical protein